MQHSKSSKGVDRSAIQRKTFLSWVNAKMAGDNRIGDISELGDGINLIALFEGLAGKSLGKAVVANPKGNLQKIGNLTAVINAFQADGVRVDISAQDLVETKETMVLGFIWVLIRKYGKVESNEKLLVTLRKLCQHYSIPESDSINAKWFQDGLLFSAIVHSNDPKVFSFVEIRGQDARQRLATAFQAAETSLKVPKMLDVDDVLLTNLDADSIVTYISSFNLKIDSLPDPSDGPEKKEVIDWEALYKDEHRKANSLERDLAAQSDKLDKTEIQLNITEEQREKLEDEVETLRNSLRQASGEVIDATAEIARLRDSHDKKIEELRLAEEEKEKELVQVRQESRALEEEKEAAMARLEEANQRSASDEKKLQELGVSKRHLESEIEALHRNLESKDQNQTTLVAQSEEMKQVLAGLMEQLENVSKEEATVHTRKKGSDKERDTLALQMERLLKEKKELEKKHDKAMKELEKIKKNRDSEIKKLKKRIEEVQRASVQKMDTSEKDKEIERLQKLLNEALQRENERKKVTEEALRKMASNLEEIMAEKASLELQVASQAGEGMSDEAMQKEMDKMKAEHEAKLEEMRVAEEAKSQELEKLKLQSKELEDQKNELEKQITEMNTQYANDVRLLSDLGSSKRQLEGEIDALRTRLQHQDQSQNDLVVQAEEMKQVLAGLMEQLEAVAKEENAVSVRKKGQDTNRDQMTAKMEKLAREKKEIEKENERTLAELEKIKKNRDSEIKKLKKRMEEVQKSATKGGGKEIERLREDIRALEAKLEALQEELEQKKSSEQSLAKQLAETKEMLNSKNEDGTMSSRAFEEREKKWKEDEDVMTKKINLYVRDLAHYKERKLYYKSKYRKNAQPNPEKDKEREKEKERKEKERREREKKERKEREKELKRKEKEDRKKEKEDLKKMESQKKAAPATNAN